jgi:hypothetical protein
VRNEIPKSPDLLFIFLSRPITKLSLSRVYVLCCREAQQGASLPDSVEEPQTAPGLPGLRASLHSAWEGN